MHGSNGASQVIVDTSDKPVYTSLEPWVQIFESKLRQRKRLGDNEVYAEIRRKDYNCWRYTRIQRW